MSKSDTKTKKSCAAGETATPRPEHAADPQPAVDGQSPVGGKSLRKQAPRSAHGIFKPSLDRRDPVEILERVERRPRAAPGADSLLADAAVGVRVLSRRGGDHGGRPGRNTDRPVCSVQACGDCHLLNFGVFATPERKLIFDVNDFDETLPAPWEWDVKRLATSFVIAGRHNGFRARRVARGGAGGGAQLSAADGAVCRRCGRSTCGTSGSTWRTCSKSFRARRFATATQAQLERPSAGWPSTSCPTLIEQTGAQTLIRDNPPLIYHPQHAEAIELVEHLPQAFDRISRSRCPTSGACCWIVIIGRPRGEGGGRRQRGHAVRHVAADGRARAIRCFCK